MATNTTTSLDVPVAVKVNINGTDENRKFKLSLKDLPAPVLPDKLRNLLDIPSNKDVVFERYSDSSASFITLDSSNIAVYKQLYRAAKAKGKLRIRATITEKPTPMPEMSQPPLVAERLPIHSYVPPYISDATNAESSPSSRISTLEDLKTLAATPSVVTLRPPTCNYDDELGQHSTYLPNKISPVWHFTDGGAWCDADRSNLEGKDVSTDGAEKSVAEKKVDEAPVPGIWSPGYRCRKEFDRFQTKTPTLPKTVPCRSFAICCNMCDDTIENVHWHCGICDNGDFDMCEACVTKGLVCGNEQHWMIKRFVLDGKIINSTTEKIAPKKAWKPEQKEVPGAFAAEAKTEVLERTCNCCVGVFHESGFVTCTTCDDYDLCIPCHLTNKHGHHPSHTFEPASHSTVLEPAAHQLLAAGRNVNHNATCDGCEKDIFGVRHKCLNCPDWDYCSSCVKYAARDHPRHRFAALYEPIVNQRDSNQVHEGIYCDGYLCEGKEQAIRGDRYKCAVCHDTDFCANCEASPKLGHNRTHPLLKFKTPVRNVSVSTFGEKQNGEQMRAMGDQPPPTSSKSTETMPLAPSANAATQVQTIAEVKPMENKASAVEEDLPRLFSHKCVFPPKELHAHFVRDTIIDGSVMTPTTQFAQTWTLRNPGPHAWPVGCSVCFIGGDGMLNVDPNHPSHITQIRNAIRSNTIDRVVCAGDEIDFKVVMRAPEREGKAISYWRLKTANGRPFGHKLWCDIEVRQPVVKTEEAPNAQHIEDIAIKKEEVDEEVKQEQQEEQPSTSQMIFPKLDKESPVSSTHQDAISPAVAPATAPTPVSAPNTADLLEDVESLDLGDDDESESEGFLTDEEYELIAAGDEIDAAMKAQK